MVNYWEISHRKFYYSNDNILYFTSLGKRQNMNDIWGICKELFVWLRRSSSYRGARSTYAAHVPVIPSTVAPQLSQLIHYSPVGDSIYLVSTLSAVSLTTRLTTRLAHSPVGQASLLPEFCSTMTLLLANVWPLKFETIPCSNEGMTTALHSSFSTESW